MREIKENEGGSLWKAKLCLRETFQVHCLEVLLVVIWWPFPPVWETEGPFRWWRWPCPGGDQVTWFRSHPTSLQQAQAKSSERESWRMQSRQVLIVNKKEKCNHQSNKPTSVNSYEAPILLTNNIFKQILIYRLNHILGLCFKAEGTVYCINSCQYALACCSARG